jgi:7-carboxy-7-deazaguanine synthase
MGDIYLAEPLHTVIQGEGPNLGKKMIVVRTAGCELKCPECDSPHTWKRKGLKYNINVLRNELEKISKLTGIQHIMLTGGEPQLYEHEITKLFCRSRFDWDIETAGLKPWNYYLSNHKRITFNFSPKIGALVPRQKQNWYALDVLAKNYSIKIVVSKDTWEEDIKIIYNLIEEYKLPRNKIYLMPKGITREEILKQSSFLIEKCFSEGLNFSPRLHILIYDNKKLI